MTNKILDSGRRGCTQELPQHAGRLTAPEHGTARAGDQGAVQDARGLHGLNDFPSSQHFGCSRHCSAGHELTEVGRSARVGIDAPSIDLEIQDLSRPRDGDCGELAPAKVRLTINSPRAIIAAARWRRSSSVAPCSRRGTSLAVLGPRADAVA